MLPLDDKIAPVLQGTLLIFGLTIVNMPTMNLRGQYALDRQMIFSSELSELLKEWGPGRIDGERAITVSYPEPDAYFTTLIRGTIVGIECSLQNATIEELAFTNRLTESVMKKVKNPSRLSRSMVDAYFNKMPEMTREEAGLKSHDIALWEEVQQFYREVRNPIFHGNQLSKVSIESLYGVFGMFDKIYAWLDTWTMPDRVQRILSSTQFDVLK